MDVPYTKIIVDSRHAAAGTSTNFDITLPETLNLPQNAACWVSDVVISNTMPTLGTGSGTLRHNFYFMERYDGAIVLNRAHLDETKMYNSDSFAAEIQAKMNQVSLDASAPYTVTYSEDLGAMVFSRPVVSDRSFFIVNDDLLETTGFQNAMVCRTGVNQDPWTPDYQNPRSAMQYIGLGRRSTKNLSWPALISVIQSNGLFTLEHSGAIDVRRCASIYLHSTTLTNYKCLGPAGSRSILAKIPVNAGQGNVLVYQHSGHILDYTPCGGSTLQTINFDLRSGDNEPIDLRGGFVSFTLLFGLAPIT